MARATFYTYPLDTPLQRAPGIVHSEKDIFSQEGPNRGFYVGFKESALDASKGNRSDSTWEPRRALTGPGPFRNLR